MTVQSCKENSAPHCIPPSSPIIFPSQILRLVVWQKLEEMRFYNDSWYLWYPCYSCCTASPTAGNELSCSQCYWTWAFYNRHHKPWQRNFAVAGSSTDLSPFHHCRYNRCHPLSQIPPTLVVLEPNGRGFTRLGPTWPTARDSTRLYLRSWAQASCCGPVGVCSAMSS